MAESTETAQAIASTAPLQASTDSAAAPANEPGSNRNKQHGNKRKRDNRRDSRPMQHGGKPKGRDMGRGEYNRQQLDKRGRNAAEQAKRQKLENEGGPKGESYLPAPFSQEEIAAEDRKPKKKVAVMIGYSGSGYKGMQIMPNKPTIEGELFSAFVAAGAISKANADDPKKSALVRCARTDKGVHAAGNIVSLKMIVEDEDIVEKINQHLSPQIRVWGIERTTGSFSCYQACDSRWYEYMLPTHTLLPPHPQSFMGRKLVELAQEADDLEEHQARQQEVKNFWTETEAVFIRPILRELDEGIRKKVESALYAADEDPESAEDTPEKAATEVEVAADLAETEEPDSESTVAANASKENGTMTAATEKLSQKGRAAKDLDPETLAVREAVRKLKAAYLQARREYRIAPARIARLQDALNEYVGTHNFHNFTVRKTAKDPSCKRHIKSFEVHPVPIVKNGAEWLSLRVHGQSFMMHQIRKMVGLAALVVRCGCTIGRIKETFTETVVSIPKAPSLGLLLERPVFDNYNTNQAAKHERSPIDFSKYEKEMQAFKDREIYEKMFRVEEEDGVYSTFFAHLDGYKEPFFLYLSSGGLKAAGDPRKARTERGAKIIDGESEDEKVQGGEEG